MIPNLVNNVSHVLNIPVIFMSGFVMDFFLINNQIQYGTIHNDRLHVKLFSTYSVY